MYFYAARQPILDQAKNVYAYELLFRDGISNIFPDIDGDEATSKMIDASKFSLGISEFTSGYPAFINFTMETLSQGYPLMLNTDEVVIEILETVKPGKKLLALCKDLYEKGYTIALDDYIHQNVWEHFYPYIKIIKIDWQNTSSDGIQEIAQAIVNFPHIKLLAEKVETYEEYNAALELGCEYFQGFFFAKPEMVKTKSLSPSQLSMAELLYETSKKDLNLASITSIFERDVSLSYKLLRYANAPIFKRGRKISTIKQALVILGSLELKRFLGFIFASNVNPNKPTELIKAAMSRAKFSELISHDLSGQHDTEHAFLTGLLSLIDALLDEEISSILAKLPLSQDIKDTLIKREGDLAKVIMLLEDIEKAQWDETTTLIEALKLDKKVVIEHYNQALIWADEQSQLA